MISRQGGTTMAFRRNASWTSVALGLVLTVSGLLTAGAQAQFPDTLWKDVDFADTAAAVLAAADVLVKVQPPTVEEVGALKPGAVTLSFVYGHQRPDLVRAMRDGRITAFAMELVPRISRAQSMDALSSQASTAGYQAALIAALTLDRFLPMLTTAAGTAIFITTRHRTMPLRKL